MVVSVQPLDPSLLIEPVPAAHYLLGAVLERRLAEGTVLSGRIVEVEAYFQEDPASHTFRGPTARNAAMFGEPGHAYIYLSYGIHWCFNVTAGPAGYGAGLLVRALEPLTGTATMEELRGLQGRHLADGPGKLTQALGIGPELYGHDLRRPPLRLLGAGRVPATEVERSRRIGISAARDELLRFTLRGSRFVSRRP